ncbi:cell wall-binding repeat-containing protein [Clostridium sp. ASBs410]|nr:cell wall-binding repeat-containing protein [Clostridium sp. ASBs410]
MNKRKSFALLSATLAVISVPIPSYGAWIQKDNHWIYEDNKIYEKNAWRLIDGAWYYFDDTGYMVTGWRLIDGKWYFLSPDSDETKGKMLTGWQWIDGRCYYLSDRSENNHPKGALYINEKTPDGYPVDYAGAWTDEDGTVQYVPGKGIQTVFAKEAASKNKLSGKGSGGGGSGSRRSSTKPEKDIKPDSGPKDSIPGVGESEAVPGTQASEEPWGGTNEPEEERKQYRYTVRYMAVKDKTILQVVAGAGTEGELIAITRPVIDGYKPCDGQKESFKLTDDHMLQNVYYEKESVASPSEARRVDWNLYFVEEGNRSNEILKVQQGQTEEDRLLVVDFPEIILGADRYYYHSLVSSPWSVIVNGNGTQKYYIEYEKGDYLQEEEDPDYNAKAKQEKWLGIAKDADIMLSGQEPSDQQLITKSIEESNERLLNLVSMADGTERKEVYLIAKGHVPSTVIISQIFQNIKNLSELVMDEFNIADEKYTIVRVGFEKAYDEITCSHDFQVTDEVNTTCIENGHETVRCQKCGKEETVILPATGHVDFDHDGICEVCYRPAFEIPKTMHYSIGDVQARTIRNKVYMFRCVDEDYEDVMGNSQRTALFLCDSVIRSDILKAENKLNFGSNNNYKYSEIREWLLNHAEADFVHETYIGITRSYIGATWKGSYEQFNDNSLMVMKEMFQLLQDKVFILSVDEALKYREVLWRFNGSKTNNPGSQVSAYSKGYYLRTPQDGGLNDFLYGDGIYAVSLVDGNIQPVSVKETSFGIRPAMAIPQG